MEPNREARGGPDLALPGKGCRSTRGTRTLSSPTAGQSGRSFQHGQIHPAVARDARGLVRCPAPSADPVPQGRERGAAEQAQQAPFTHTGRADAPREARHPAWCCHQGPDHDRHAQDLRPVGSSGSTEFQEEGRPTTRSTQDARRDPRRGPAHCKRDWLGLHTDPRRDQEARHPHHLSQHGCEHPQGARHRSGTQAR